MSCPFLAGFLSSHPVLPKSTHSRTASAFPAGPHAACHYLVRGLQCGHPATRRASPRSFPKAPAVAPGLRTWWLSRVSSGMKGRDPTSNPPHTPPTPSMLLQPQFFFLSHAFFMIEKAFSVSTTPTPARTLVPDRRSCHPRPLTPACGARELRDDQEGQGQPRTGARVSSRSWPPAWGPGAWTGAARARRSPL